MRNFIIIFLVLGGLFNNIYAQEAKSNRLTKIVLDPGHGGDKPGAKGRISLEKDINLAVSLKLGKIINENLPDVNVVYTRKTDKDVDLIKRSQIANREKADIFISIHCNAAKNHEATGTETFVMGLAKTQENIEAAKKENADILTEANYAENYDGFNPNSPEANIFFALYQNAYLEQSLLLADKMQKQYTFNTNLLSRGVKQAPYLVLYKTSVPAVLTEIGFISNAREEKYLNTQLGQYKIAASIFQAIFQYKQRLEGTNLETPSIESLIPKEAIAQDKEAKEKEAQEKRIAEEKRKQKELEEKKQKEEAKKAEELAKKIKQDLQKKDTTTLKETNKEDKETKSNNQTIVYRVQFFANETKFGENNTKFKGIEDLWMYKEGKMWKYTSGRFDNFDSANTHKTKIREKGHKDAFVVIFHKDKRKTIEEAKKKEKQLNK